MRSWEDLAREIVPPGDRGNPAAWHYTYYPAPPGGASEESQKIDTLFDRTRRLYGQAPEGSDEAREWLVVLTHLASYGGRSEGYRESVGHYAYCRGDLDGRQGLPTARANDAYREELVRKAEAWAAGQGLTEERVLAVFD